MVRRTAASHRGLAVKLKFAIHPDRYPSAPAFSGRIMTFSSWERRSACGSPGLFLNRVMSSTLPGFSILEQSFDIGNFRGSSTGITVNAGGGFLARLTVRTNLDLGMTYGYTQFRSFEMVDKQSTERFLGPTGSGSNLVARIGLAIGVRG
jgi:hypothetical protein